MAANFDLSSLAIQAVCPNNVLLYDDKNMPSVMVYVPKFRYVDVGLGTSTATFPAFLIDGIEVDGIYISKYINIVNNSRAYSLPGQDPKTSINFDTALSVCANKGKGWHCMTALEWGAIILWCEHNGFIPLGNVAYGKYHTETNYKAIPANKDSSGNTLRTKTGTGPLTWFHDQTPSGIADLCGCVFEWAGGIRSVYGELQILTYTGSTAITNAAANKDHSQAASSALWMAIDATTGLLITPNGSGTTTNSIKMDWVSSKLQYNTTITDSAPGEHYCQFKDINCSANIADAAKNTLMSLGFLPVSGTLCTAYGRCYFNNAQEERSFSRGGNYYSTSAYSFPSFSGSNGRSGAYGDIGFRSAFVELPAA